MIAGRDTEKAWGEKHDIMSSDGQNRLTARGFSRLCSTQCSQVVRLLEAIPFYPEILKLDRRNPPEPCRMGQGGQKVCRILLVHFPSLGS